MNSTLYIYQRQFGADVTRNTATAQSLVRWAAFFDNNSLNFLMLIRSILSLVSISLLIYLLMIDINYIDFAATKNNHLTAWQKAEIDAANNIDSVKLKAKQSLDIIRQDARNDSKVAIRSSRILTVILIIQIILLTIYFRRGNKK